MAPSRSNSTSQARTQDDLEPHGVTDGYEPPRIERLGSLAELTLGGRGPNDDGFGGAGDDGSV